MPIAHMEISEEILENISRQIKPGATRVWKWDIVKIEIRKILPHDYLTDSEVRYVLEKVREFRKAKARQKIRTRNKTTESGFVITAQMRKEALAADLRHKRILGNDYS